jgi:N-acetylglucosamine PTS system EIICBA or EIICB component
MKQWLEKLQPIGRALMLPIAVLPIAGLLLRVGQPDLLNVAFIAAAGEAIFANLGLMFAIGVAVGLARENHGAAALAGVVCYLVAAKGAEALIQIDPSALAGVPESARDLAANAARAKEIGKFSVPLGILSGLTAGLFYNRYFDIKLPDYLAFFGGRRFVPIVSGVAGLGFALVFGLGWGVLESGMDAFSHGIVESGNVGLFVYGVLNRLLIVTGLHHILNNVAWFIVGDYNGVTGDLKRFFAGDPAAGVFMSGFFPVMMFGLPAACLAMYRTAPPARRKAVGGMLLSLALTSLLTGVTEPIEFTFMFLAPVLYAVHAVMTGLGHVIMNMLGVKLGFGFSAGLFDYVLNFGKATRPWMLLPVGIAYFAIYYALFRFAIIRLGLATPGRETAAEGATPAAAVSDRGFAFLTALGGTTNLQTVDACTTRLRLQVADQARVDEAALRGLGARGFVRPSDHALQVVLGPIADQVAGEIRRALGDNRQQRLAEPSRPEGASVPSLDAAPLLTALGGPANVRGGFANASRVCVELADVERIVEGDLRRIGVRSIARIDAHTVHLVVGPAAPATFAALQLRGLVAIGH